MKQNLGKLESEDLRTVWKSEPEDFTPWLAQEENIQFLGDVIGIPLEVEAEEKDVGPFRADILCRDLQTDKWVLIENQLERTDHTHLGQLITYAAGLDAVTIIWIAREFAEEHRAAIDWMNSITDDSVNFFGIQVELWKIGESQLAPKFNVIAKPNDWTRRVKRGAIGEGELTEFQKLQLEYWKDFALRLKEEGCFRFTKPTAWAYMSHSIGRSGCCLVSVASKYNSEIQGYSIGENRVALEMSGNDLEILYERLFNEKKAIEREAGEPLIWSDAEGSKIRRVYVRQNAELTNRFEWPNQHKWLLEKLHLFSQLFSNRIKRNL